MRAQLRAACWDWDIQIGSKRDLVQLNPQLAGLPSPHTGTLGRDGASSHSISEQFWPSCSALSSRLSYSLGMYKLQIQKLDTNKPNKLPSSCVTVRLHSMPSEDTCRDVIPDRPERLGSNR